MSTFTFRKSMTSNLGTARLGGDVAKLLSKATQLSDNTTGNGRMVAFDTNNDGQADTWENESLDANGKAIYRSVTQYLNGVSVTVNDNNADGKIDGFSRYTGNVGYSVSDGNFDGKADQQTEAGKTSSHSYWDTNFDGKADSRQDSRKATRKDHFDAISGNVPAGAQMGGQISALVPTGAHQVSWSEGANYQSSAWDLNGDYNADVSEWQQLDANRQVVSTTLSFTPPTNPDGSPGMWSSVSDTNGDGQIDNVSDGQNSWTDWNHDGKIDSEFKNVNGASVQLSDNDGDGKVDWVSSYTQLA